MSVIPKYIPTPLSEIEPLHARLRKTFKSGKTLPIAYRRKQLIQLGKLLQENVTAIEDALLIDLGRPRFETAVPELSTVMSSIFVALQGIEEWAKPERPKVEEWRSNWETVIYNVPKGVAIIISPWNYPYVLTFNPLVGAIAAGCPVVIKPSEHCPNASALMAKLVTQYLDPEAYVTVNGAVTETTALLNLRWDHIFYTGNGTVGKIIAAAAAKNYTPITLELGGKSPVIIGEDCDLEVSARRILWGKVQNAGQVCVAPDHVYVPRSIIPAFNKALQKAHTQFFPASPFDKKMTYSEIVNESHQSRVMNLLRKSVGDVILGGEADGNSKRIAPTVVLNVKGEDSLMEEEIFGPILPLIPVDSLDEAIRRIGDGPAPLVIYAFSNSEELKERLLKETRSGTIVFNDTFMQLLVHELPFGGVGESGQGSYYGKNTFDTFSHRRSFLNVPTELDSGPFFQARYPPYTQENYNALSAGLRAPLPEA